MTQALPDRRRLAFFISKESLDDIESLAGYLADGAITPTVGQ